jgi:integrase
LHQDRAYTHQEIAQLLDASNLRLPAIFLLIASSGCRVGAISHLKLSNLHPVPEYNLYHVVFYEGSISDEYYSFTTPEAKKAIDDYLYYRQRSGKRLTPKSLTERTRSQCHDQKF